MALVLTVICMTLSRSNSLYAVSHFVEGFSDIVNKESTVCTSVKCCTQRLISLLTSCVPDLKSHDFIIDGNFFIRKICAYRWLKVFSESTVFEHLDQTCLAYSRVTYRYYFNKALLLWTHCLYSLYVVWSDFSLFTFFSTICGWLHRRILEWIGFGLLL